MIYSLSKLFRIFDCAEATFARQSSNKFDIALTYSYLWLTPKILRLGIIKLTLASALDFSYLWLRLRYFASEKMQASLLFSLGLFVSLQRIGGGSAIFCVQARTIALTFHYLCTVAK